MEGSVLIVSSVQSTSQLIHGSRAPFAKASVAILSARSALLEDPLLYQDSSTHLEAHPIKGFSHLLAPGRMSQSMRQWWLVAFALWVDGGEGR